MTNTMQVTAIPMTAILYDEEFNCRGPISPMDVVDLAKNISENGLIQPVVVVPIPPARAGAHPDKQYLLIAGYRRYTAFKVNKETTIPAVIRQDVGNEMDARFFNLSENLQRTDLNIMQESRALAKLERLGVTEAQAAEKLNMSRGWVQVRYMVLRLPEVVQQEIAAGWLTQTQIRKVYTEFNDEGELACFERVKEFKDDKIRGRKIVKKRKTKKAAEADLKKKKHRDRDDIFALQEHVYMQNSGNSVVTRVLAWCAGEINSVDVHATLKEWFEAEGKTYRLP